MARPKSKRRGKRRGTPAERQARKRRRKKKAPAPSSKRGGGRRAATTRDGRRPSKSKVAEFPAAVKRVAPAVRAKPGKRKKLSRHPEAVRARRYRADRRAIEDAREAARLAKNERARARRRQRKEEAAAAAQARRPITERDLAIEWLEDVRNHAAAVAPCSLSIVAPEAASAGAWLVCGRFDLHEPISYAEMGESLERLLADDLLAAKIHPQRLSQIRIIYNDPNARRGEADSIVSKIAGWEFALGDLIGEILGGGRERYIGSDALAVRYEHTTIAVFYVYFAPSIVEYRTMWPGATTMTVPLDYQRKTASHHDEED